MAKEKAKEPLSPSKRKELRKQKENQETKQNLTQDYAYTGIPGAKATAKGVKYSQDDIPTRLQKNETTINEVKMAKGGRVNLRGGGCAKRGIKKNAYGRNS
jgi:hypothetical protein